MADDGAHVRGQTLSLKEKEFVEAARAGGSRSRSIIFRHIVPNLTGPVVIYATLTVPEIILVELRPISVWACRRSR